jgi:hypothetical protein
MIGANTVLLCVGSSLIAGADVDVTTCSNCLYCLLHFLCRCDEEEEPDLTTLTPKVSLMINESDVIDISVDKHGKSDNFIINLDSCNQLLLSAASETLKERVSSIVVRKCMLEVYHIFILHVLL